MTANAPVILPISAQLDEVLWSLGVFLSIALADVGEQRLGVRDALKCSESFDLFLREGHRADAAPVFHRLSVVLLRSRAAGFGGKLDDVAVALTEDGSACVVFTFYASDYSPHVCFDLTAPQVATFDPAAVARFFETRIVAH